LIYLFIKWYCRKTYWYIRKKAYSSCSKWRQWPGIYCSFLVGFIPLRSCCSLHYVWEETSCFLYLW